MAWDPVRKWMTRRPLMLFAACLTAGMAIGCQNAVAWPFWAVGLAVSAAFGFWRKRLVFVFSSALLLGALLVTVSLIKPAVSEQDNILLTGRLASEPTIKEEYTRITLESTCADGQPLPTRVMLYLYGPELPPLEYGAEIAVPADTYLPSDRENPYSDSYTAYLWRQGVALCASASSRDLIVTAPPGFSITGLPIRCRTRLQSVVDSLYSEDISPLISALLLGDRSMLPEDLYENFKTAGLAHLLAISGLHISCLAVVLDHLLRKLRCPGGATVFLVTLLLFAYAALVGFPASILRAVLMYFLSAGAQLAGRPSDGLTGLSMALIVLLLINPLYIEDISFILSFSSVAGLMCLTRLLSPKSLSRVPDSLRKPLYWVITALSASLSAQLGSLPTIVCVFGYLSTYSLISNLPSLPLMTIALPAAMGSVFLGLFIPSAGRIAAFPVEWGLRALVCFTNWVASLPGASITSPVWPAALILLYAGACVLCSQVSRIRRHFKQLIICLLPVCAASAFLLPLAFPTSGLEVLFLDVGQADAALIRAEDKYYLMDVGEDSTMADYLADSGVRPTAVFLSHPHSDHAGGLPEIVELCEPATIYIPCLWYDVEADEGVPELLAEAQAAGWRIETLEAGDILSLSSHVTAEVFQPYPNMTDDANGVSLCIDVSIGDSSVLFTGDLPSDEEYAFFPDCDVLKVAHHGAKGSTSRLFLNMTSPSAAVISVGHNSYGHPTPETISRLEAAGAAIYRTDQCGAVSVLLGTEGIIQITPMKTATESEAAS